MRMNSNQAALARKQLDRRLEPLRSANLIPPPKGWIKAIREALGMTARQLASRMGVAPSRIPVIEKAEITGSTTIKSLRQAAEALDCQFVYGFVPRSSLDETLRARVAQKTGRTISRLDHTMKLENQALQKPDLLLEQQRMIDFALNGSLRGLWEDD
ncbi:mobile mystery protein A [Sphingomonas sp. ASY06-1R]|uniref:mobile mystery protein A n=1 Tax=Sphingomonas sp. ASY06-1R TaxID=3445771 RepID=UPI003FA2307B